jgi:hypothetical protein
VANENALTAMTILRSAGFALLRVFRSWLVRLFESHFSIIYLLLPP